MMSQLTKNLLIVFSVASSLALGQQPPANVPTPHYDLLLKGGHVIDPANSLDKIMDVGISAGKIAAVATSLPASEARKVVNVSGLYVTPGLVDIHAHVGRGGGPLDWFEPEAKLHAAPMGIPADLVLTSGVTTLVDAGTSGADTFLREKREVIDHASVRVLAFLNIVADGMEGGTENDVSRMDVKLCGETIQKFPDIIVGVKTAHFWTEKPWDAEHAPWDAVDRAEACGQLAGVPVMVDFWPRPERPYADLILKKMRPGDIHTHVFAQQFPVLLANGKLNPILAQARQRGVIFDVGHGGGSFWFRNAVPAVRQGFIPDSMSTDLHTGDYMFVSMTDVMSKFLAMGVPLEDIIRRSTVNPAREIRRPELGTLSVGREADVAVLEVLHGHFGYIDDGWSRMDGNVKVVARMTLRGGKILFDPSGLSMVEWTKARKQYFSSPVVSSSPPAKADDYPRK
jgi:dihydroorotase